MKTTRVFSSAALMMSIGVAQLVACSSDSKNTSSESEPAGTLRLPLQTVSPSGHVYRLRNAFFDIVNTHDASFAAFLSSETDPSSSTLSQVLTTGDYTITLTPGWQLERVIFDGSGGSGNGGSGNGGSVNGGSGRGGSGRGGAGSSSGGDGAVATAGGMMTGGGTGRAGGPSKAIPFDQAGVGASFAGDLGFAEGGVGGFFEEFGGSPSSGGKFQGSGGKFQGSGGSPIGGGGIGIPVDAHLLSEAVQLFGIFSRSDSFVTYSFQVGGEVLEFNQGRLNVGIDVTEAEVQCDSPANVTRPERVLLENSVDAVAKISLRDVFGALANNGDVKGDAETLFNQVYDSYATAGLAKLPDAVHCGDEVTNGAPSLNGFPITCNRVERNHVGAIDSFRALAVVNRIDLAPENGANCGQQRMIFAHLPFNRAFMILEAQIPNPRPDLGILGCTPLAKFWFDQNEVGDASTRGSRLARAFLTGDPDLAAQGFGAFYTPTNLTVGSGQIRTNQFDSDPWTLREFKLAADGETLKTIPFPTAEAPNGQLWNENIPFPQGPACRENFLTALDGLLTPDAGQMSFVVDQQCRDAESRNDFSQSYDSQLSTGFRAQLNQRLAGTGLSADDIANRAQFAGSCIGCHNESSGRNLGLGVSAPFSSDFPHVTEIPSNDCGPRNVGTQCFPTSTALKELFLPSRLNTLTALLGAPIVTDPCENPGGGNTGGFPGFGGSPGVGGRANGSGGSVDIGGFFSAGSTGVAGGGPVRMIEAQGTAPSVVISLPSAKSPLSELVTLDAALRAKSGERTIGGRSAQVTH